MTHATHQNKIGDVRTERFAYDPARNITAGTEVRAPFGGAQRAVEAARRYTPGGRIERRGDTTFAYDAQGRLVSKRVDKRGFRPQHWRYAWDGEDQLARVHTPDGAVWAYDYDPFGRRIGKRCVKGGNKPAANAPAQVAYVWDGNLLSGERRIYADGTESTVEYHYEQDSFVPLAQVVDGDLNYIVTDQIGTPREMFSEDGELTWGRHQKLWGATEGFLRLDAANDNAGYQTCLLRFQGQIEDEESGLYYNRFRYYDADGGYISSDPIGLEGGARVNAYTDNSIKGIDPYGLATSEADRTAIDTILGDAKDSKGVYRFTDANGKVYVGSTVDQSFADRLRQHLNKNKINSNSIQSIRIHEMNKKTAEEIFNVEASEIARNGGRARKGGTTSNIRRPPNTGELADSLTERAKLSRFDGGC